MPIVWGLAAIAAHAQPVVSIDATGADGRLRVAVTAPGVSLGPADPQLPISDPHLADDEVHYTVALGTDGRHGHQGWLDGTWGTFDGRILAPVLGLADADRIEVAIRVPGGWSVAAPFAGSNGRYAVVRVAGQGPWDILTHSCVGVGPLVDHRVRIGEMSLEVWAVEALGSAAISELAEGTEALVGYFHRVLGWTPPHPVVVVWGPTARGRPVHGGASPRGSCSSHAGDRGWELLAHRLAHAIDRDPPSAFTLVHPRDRWFIEGWASHAEIIATNAVGLVPPGRLQRLGQRRRAALRQHPDWRIPLAAEATATGDLAEHLHYVHGPLVAAELDRALIERTGSDLAAFVAELSRRGGAVDLRRALHGWSGASFDDFWRQHVDQIPIR